MESEIEYQKRELRDFMNQKFSYFDSVGEFDEYIKWSNFLESLEWIENGSYGAGACFALQIAEKSITNRSNGNARIGNVFLHALYGKPFLKWHKLSKDNQKRINEAVTKWRKGKRNYAIEIKF